MASLVNRISDVVQRIAEEIKPTVVARSAFDALKAGSALKTGRIYLILDESRLAFAVSASTSFDVPLPSELGGPPSGIQMMLPEDSATHMSSFLMSGTTTNAALNANLLRAIPFFVNRTWSPTRIGVRSGTFTSSVGVRLGISRDSGVGQTGQLVADASSVTLAAANTNYEATLSGVTLTPGLYWLLACTNGISANVVCFDATDVLPMFGFNSTMVPFTGLQRSFTYGALPSDDSAQTYTRVTGAGMSPVIWLRKT